LQPPPLFIRDGIENIGKDTHNHTLGIDINFGKVLIGADPNGQRFIAPPMAYGKTDK
jgi:hypothetical protein